jgi:hypothetical protein
LQHMLLSKLESYPPVKAMSVHTRGVASAN